MKINDYEMRSVKSIIAFDEPAGEVLRIEFHNGSYIDITPENDGFHFHRKPGQELPTVSVMTHITGEFQSSEDESIEIVMGKGVEITVSKF